MSNSNPTYADVEVNEDYGTVNVKFKNETRSSITLIKDVKEVKYNITSKESDGQGGFINNKVIGTDISSTKIEETLHYELGVTPQNKTIVYTFEQVDYPMDYYKVGTFEVTVEYDMYGNIKKISDNSNRVDAIENPEKSHDIVVMVSEYKENDSGADSGDIDKSSVTIVKDNTRWICSKRNYRNNSRN